MRYFNSGVFALLALASSSLIAQDQKSTEVGAAVVKGRVQTSDAKQFTLRAIDGRKMVFRAPDNTKWRFPSRDVSSPSELKNGDRVMVTYRQEDDSTKAVAVFESRVTPEEVVREFKEAFQVTKSYAYEQKEEYVQIVQGLLAEMDDLLFDMAREAEKEGGDAQQAYEKAKDRLQTRVQETQKGLTNAVKSGTKSWEQLKAEVDESVNELERAYEEARKEFDQRPTRNSDTSGKPQVHREKKQ